MDDIKCGACNKIFNNFSEINKHLFICDKYSQWIKTHKPKYFNCKYCDSSFVNREYLRKHDITCNGKILYSM